MSFAPGEHRKQSILTNLLNLKMAGFHRAPACPVLGARRQRFTEMEKRQLEAYIRVRQAMGKKVRDLQAA